MELDSKETLLKFPCDFAIKIFGKSSNLFEITVLGIIRDHFDDIKENAIEIRKSKDGNYIAITVTVNAKNKSQVDDCYRELSANSHVIMTL